MSIFLNEIKRKVLDCFKVNKVYFIFLISFFLLGVIIGLISVFTYFKILDINNLTDSCLLNYLKDKIGLFSFLIRRFFHIFLIFISIFIISFNKFTCFLNSVILLYLGYILIFNLSVIIICFGFFGVIYSLISILIIGLALNLLLIITMMICRDCCLCNFGFLNGCKDNFILFLILLALILVLCILEILLLPFLSSTFIVNYF